MYKPSSNFYFVCFSSRVLGLTEPRIYKFHLVCLVYHKDKRKVNNGVCSFFCRCHEPVISRARFYKTFSNELILSELPELHYIPVI